MKIFIRFFLLTKRQLKNPAFILLLLLLPVLSFFISRTENSDTSENGYRIALYAAGRDSFTEDLFSKLSASSSSVFSFYCTADEAAAVEDVVSGQAEFAYIFPADYTASFLSGNYRRKIKVYRSPSSLPAALPHEVVFAAIFETLGDEIAFHYIEETASFKELLPVFSTALPPLYHRLSEGSSLFAADYETLASAGAENSTGKEPSVSFPVRGLLSVLLFTSGLCGGVTLLQDRQKKLPVSGVFSVCPIIVPVFLLLLSGYLSLMLSGNLKEPFLELVLLLFYLVLIAAYVRVLCFFLKGSFWLTAAIPAFTLASLIFCPVFMDISTLLPAASLLEKLFPPYYYLMLCNYL